MALLERAIAAEASSASHEVQLKVSLKIILLHSDILSDFPLSLDTRAQVPVRLRRFLSTLVDF